MTIVLLNATLVLASPDPNGESLEKTKETLNCKIDFTLSILNAYQSVANGSNFSSLIVNLSNDKVKLVEISSTKNVSAVRNFVKNILDVDLKNARLSVEMSRSSKHQGLSKEQKQTLKDAYKKAHDSFRSCQQTNLKLLGEKRVELFTKILSDHLILANKFSERGLDTTGMKKIIDDAQVQIVAPLKDALVKANSSDEIQTVLRKYCLFNGCKNGVNFHFAAKFEAEKLSATLAYIKAKNLTVSDDKLSTVQSALTSARGIISEGGTTQFTDEGGKNLRNKVQSAYSGLKNVRVKATAKTEVPVKDRIKVQEKLKEEKNNEQKR